MIALAHDLSLDALSYAWRPKKNDVSSAFLHVHFFPAGRVEEIHFVDACPRKFSLSSSECRFLSLASGFTKAPQGGKHAELIALILVTWSRKDTRFKRNLHADPPASPFCSSQTQATCPQPWPVL